MSSALLMPRSQAIAQGARVGAAARPLHRRKIEESVPMLRREFISVLASLSLTGCVTGRGTVEARGPLCWLATRGKARVFIFGFGEAQDKSWFTPLIQRAFQESSELWLETAPYNASDKQDAASIEKAAELEKLGHESGRTLFDALEPQVRERTSKYIAELGIKRESIETLRPWRAYYSINSEFWSRRKLSHEPVHVDAVLDEMARRAGKSIGYEMPTGEAFVKFMAAMSDKAQSQYVEWLLDYIDDEKNGFNDDDDNFSWVNGIPGKNAMRSLNRMRKKMPDLYQVMQPKRNAWWARKIDELLAISGTYFVGVGQLHVLGPDGIPRQLERFGIVRPGTLYENPPVELLG